MEAESRYRLNTILDPDVIPMLDELAGGERKRGAMIGQLVRTAYAGQKSNADLRTMDVESLRLTVLGLNGRVQAIEGEVVRLQSQLAAMIAQS
jgi:hypothetical protein